MPIVKCDYCGKEIEKSNWLISKYKKHFCCRECQYKSQEKLNLIIEKDDYAEMYIINNNKHLVVLISKEDIDKVNKIKWNLKYDETVNNYYAQGHTRRKRDTIRLHRYLLDCPKNMEVDHINRNTLDNRRENLRCVSPNVNKNNKGFYRNNKSGYKYIHWSNIHNTYKCEIKRYKKIVYSKSCKNLEKLVEMRDKFIEENINLWQ